MPLYRRAKTTRYCLHKKTHSLKIKSIESLKELKNPFVKEIDIFRFLVIYSKSVWLIENKKKVEKEIIKNNSNKDTKI